MSAYVRQARRARSTGTVVEVFDSDHDASVFDSDEGGRWVTLCATHGNFVQHLRLRTALDHAADPAGWCEGCMATAPHTVDLTCSQLVSAIAAGNVPEGVTGVLWLSHGWCDPLSVVEHLVAEGHLQEQGEDDLFRWDTTGRNDYPQRDLAAAMIWPKAVAPW